MPIGYMDICGLMAMNQITRKQPFRIGLVGGVLQGVEAAYLAREAGYHVTVIDRNPEVPALALAHQAHVFDVRKEPARFRKLLLAMDAILPATEEKETLDFLADISQEVGRIFLHDPSAYAISSSKVRSNTFFSNHNIPVPKKWPDCHFPLIVKPSGASGSHGVHVVEDRRVFESVLSQIKQHYGEEIVIEAYQNGPSLSLEVIAQQGRGVGYLITELEFDDRLDCKRVYAPSRGCRDVNENLERISLDIARHLKLNGLMDVEVIVHSQDGSLVVLEMDARFPSQTPMAVYHASGINLLDEWVKVHVRGQPVGPVIPGPGCAWLEHVFVQESRLEFIGETRLPPWSQVQVWPSGSFFGATLALTDYQVGKKFFKSTLIFTGADWSSVFERRQKCLDRMAQTLGLKDILDPTFQAPQG